MPRQRTKWAGRALDADVNTFLLYGPRLLESINEPLDSLREHWIAYRASLMARHDPTTRPAAWWWFEAPKGLRIDFPKKLSPTPQRIALISAGILSGGARREAVRRVAAWKNSGQPMMFWDLRDGVIQMSGQ